MFNFGLGDPLGGNVHGLVKTFEMGLIQILSEPGLNLAPLSINPPVLVKKGELGEAQYCGPEGSPCFRLQST